MDHAGHQRCSAIQGESQARIARSARGHDGAGAGTAARGPPLSAAGSWPRCRRLVRCRMVAEPGVPAEAERAVDQDLVAADRDIGADLEIGPAQLVLDLFVTLLDGLITNGKFCCVRWVRLSLSWWHRPLRLRESALQSDVALAGERDDPDLDRVPSARPVSRRRAPVGSGLPAAGAVGRRRRPAGSGADRRGGT